MATQSNRALYAIYLEMQGEIDFASDEFKLALVDDSFSWDGARHRVWEASAWQSNTVYSEGDLVVPTSPNGYVYRCTVGGESGSSEPSWPTTFNESVSDGNAEWECWSYHTADSEITRENGYDGPITLSNASLYMDLDELESVYEVDDEAITASGGSFGPARGAVIFNNTHSETPIMAFTRFAQDYTIYEDATLTIENNKIATEAIQDYEG